MAVYLVEGPNGKTLVETRTQSSAINHVTRKDYSVKTLNTTELVKAIKDGMEIETIGEETEAEKVIPVKTEASKPAAPKIAQKKAA